MDNPDDIERAQHAKRGSPFLNTDQAAAYLKISSRLLKRLRVRGEGPMSTATAASRSIISTISTGGAVSIARGRSGDERAPDFDRRRAAACLGRGVARGARASSGAGALSCAAALGVPPSAGRVLQSSTALAQQDA